MARITMGKRPEKATKTEQADTHVTANGIDLGGIPQNFRLHVDLAGGQRIWIDMRRSEAERLVSALQAALNSGA
jgi:hypothetical protein